MPFASTLSTGDAKTLRSEFNKEGMRLIADIRANTDTRPQSEYELMEMITATCQRLIQRHHFNVPPQIQPEDLIQDMALIMLKVARDPKYEVETPYQYMYETLQNQLRLLITRQQLLTTTDISATKSSADDADDMDFGEGQQVNYHLRHLQSEYEKSIEDELGDRFGEMRKNNGFTDDEKKLVQAAIKHIDSADPSLHYGELAAEYYLGDLMHSHIVANFMQKYPMPQDSAKTRLLRARENLHEALELHDPKLYNKDIRPKLERIEFARRSIRITRQEADLHDMAMAPRHFISPTEMLTKRLHKNSTVELQEELHALLVEMTTTKRREELIQLDDGFEKPASEVFIAKPSHPNGGGRNTIYIDEQAQGFIGRAMGIEYKGHKPGWHGLRRFSKYVGRPTHDASLRETYQLFLDLWKKDARIELGDKKIRVRDYVEFCSPYHNHGQGKFAEDIELPPEIAGMVMYLSPELKPYARRHLLCQPEGEQKNWLRITGAKDFVLKRLHMSGHGNVGHAAIANQLAVIYLLQDLYKQPLVECPVTKTLKKPEEFMGKFADSGGHKSSLIEKNGYWMVSESLVGDDRPINRIAVEQLRNRILHHPAEFPDFLLIQNEAIISRHASGFLPVKQFDSHIGRTGREKDARETFEFLYHLWLANPTINVGKGEVSARTLVEFDEPPKDHKPQIYTESDDFPVEVRGKIVFASPDLKSYARKHLLRAAGNEEKEWLPIRGFAKGILHRLDLGKWHINPASAICTYLATMMILEDLQKKGTIKLDGVATPIETVMGKFKIINTDAHTFERPGRWLVSPALVGEGKPLNREAIIKLGEEIIANQDKYPRFREALAALGPEMM